MLDVNKPLYAKIFDFENCTTVNNNAFIIRKVDSIEFSCKHHDNAIIWYSNGFRSESFELLEQANEQGGK